MSKKTDNKVPNVPNLRFIEYNASWQKCSLKSFTKRVTRKNVGQVSKRPLTISAQYGLIDQSEFFDRQIASKDMSGYYLLKNGEFAYNKSYSNDYPWGAVKRLDKYECGALSTLYICFNLVNSIVNSDFISHYFETNKWHKGVSDIAGEGARNHGLLNMSVEDYFLTKHYLPSLIEQEKISHFLNLISNRIETQSKIIEDLELVKKGIYNHIFTQLNSVEKILLEDLLIDFNKRTLTDKQYPILSSTLSGIYLQEEYFNKQAASATTEGYKIVPYGFATYRSMSDTGEFRFNLQTIVENGIVSPAYPVFTCIENCRLDFILFCLNYYDDIKKQLFSMKQGGTRLALHFNSLCKLYIPRINKEKQSKIMAIVNSYDAKIVTEKQILEKLKEQKKFLLSNMFI